MCWVFHYGWLLHLMTKGFSQKLYISTLPFEKWFDDILYKILGLVPVSNHVKKTLQHMFHHRPLKWKEKNYISKQHFLKGSFRLVNMFLSKSLLIITARGK